MARVRSLHRAKAGKQDGPIRGGGAGAGGGGGACNAAAHGVYLDDGASGTLATTDATAAGAGATTTATTNANANANATRIFARAAKSPEAGYVVTKAIGVGVVPTEKPQIPELPLQGQDPAEGALKGQRQIFWDGSWTTAELFEMDRLQPGNVVAGPAVVEAPATTLLVPPEWRATLDKNLIFRVEEV